MAMKARYTVVNGEVIAEKRGGVRSLYVPDPLGSTVALLDNTQAQTDTFAYWPYGEVRTRTGTTATPFQFVGTQGYYLDSSSKAYVRARYLDTTKSRWMTKDSVGYYAGDWNLYRYVVNSPIGVADPSGLQILGPTPPKPNCKKYTFPKGPYPLLPPTNKNCQGYRDLCNQGYYYGCNAWWACLHLGLPIGGEEG